MNASLRKKMRQAKPRRERRAHHKQAPRLRLEVQGEKKGSAKKQKAKTRTGFPSRRLPRYRAEAQAAYVNLSCVFALPYGVLIHQT